MSAITGRGQYAEIEQTAQIADQRLGARAQRIIEDHLLPPPLCAVEYCAFDHRQIQHLLDAQGLRAA
jgi:hypothetical protein